MKPEASPTSCASAPPRKPSWEGVVCAWRRPWPLALERPGLAVLMFFTLGAAANIYLALEGQRSYRCPFIAVYAIRGLGPAGMRLPTVKSTARALVEEIGARVIASAISIGFGVASVKPKTHRELA